MHIISFGSNFAIMEGRLGRGNIAMADKLPPTMAIYPSRPMGDLAFQTPEVRAAVLNNAIKRFWDNRNGLTPEVDRLSQMFFAQITNFKEDISLRVNREAYPIQMRYQNADIQAAGMSQQKHLEARVNTGKLRIVTDSDGTLTSNDKEYLKITPGNGVGDPLLDVLGRESFYDVYPATWRWTVEFFPELYKEIGKNSAHKRAGVDQFMEQALRQNIPVTILSANFQPMVEGIVDQIPHAEKVSILSVRLNDITSTEKGAYLNQIALDNPDDSVVYIGDGSSDKNSIEAEKNIAWYFALEGSKFAQTLQASGIQHFSTFKDFHDISRQLNSALKPVAQLTTR